MQLARAPRAGEGSLSRVTSLLIVTVILLLLAATARGEKFEGKLRPAAHPRPPHGSSHEPGAATPQAALDTTARGSSSGRAGPSVPLPSGSFASGGGRREPDRKAGLPARPDRVGYPSGRRERLAKPPSRASGARVRIPLPPLAAERSDKYGVVSGEERSRAVVQRGSGRASLPENASSSCLGARRAVLWYRDRTRGWQARRDAPRAVYAHAAHSPSCRYVRWAARLWKARAGRERHLYQSWFIRTYRKWACIHRREGAWDANTGNGYYGGLQMTVWFQRRYAPEFVARWGTADRWPVYAQLLAAERAWRGDGGSFRQWGTAGMCGLR